MSDGSLPFTRRSSSRIRQQGFGITSPILQRGCRQTTLATPQSCEPHHQPRPGSEGWDNLGDTHDVTIFETGPVGRRKGVLKAIRENPKWGWMSLRRPSSGPCSGGSGGRVRGVGSSRLPGGSSTCRGGSSLFRGGAGAPGGTRLYLIPCRHRGCSAGSGIRGGREVSVPMVRTRGGWTG